MVAANYTPLAKFLYFLKKVIGLDFTSTIGYKETQNNIYLALKNYFISNKIKVIFYKGGIFEKYFLASLNLVDIDIIDLESSAYSVPSARHIRLYLDCYDSSECKIHKLNSSHCAIKDVLCYYYYIKNCGYLKPLWPEIKNIVYVRNY